MIGRADIEGSKSNVAMNAWLPQASYPCGNFSDTSSFKFRRSKGSLGHAFTMCRPSQTPHLTMSSARIGLPEAGLGSKKRGIAPASDSRNNSELAVRRPGEGPRRSRSQSVPRPARGDPLSPRKQLEQVRRQPTGSGLGTPVPSPQSQSFSRGYGSILPTSLAYIVPSTRGCSPWRPDAVMSTTRAWEALGPPDFQGPAGGAPDTRRDVRCSSSRWTLPPTESFPGWAGC
ncbi:hypothetical protein L1887_55743 [Cichorium endivia]|nr:hypothetical protein L1887_55743 [Cichorium endivia]